jgi:hypothetical protein
MGGMPPRQPMPQGTSRLVPVAVSAGLAVGVFCGLLFGLGTGKRDASAEPPAVVSNGVKRTDDSYTPESLNPNAKIPDKNAPQAGSNTGSAVAVDTGSAGSNAGSAGSAAVGANAGSAEAGKTTKLVVEIKSETVAKFAKISIDGKEITGNTAEIPLEPGTTKKKVEVLVKAPGYNDERQEIEVDGEPKKLEVELSKSARPNDPTAGEKGAAGAAGGTTRQPGRKGRGRRSGAGKGSGLIDI